MLAALVTLAFLPADAAGERASWHNCLDTYAQVAMFGGGSTVSMALAALDACAAERRAFQLKLGGVAERADGEVLAKENQMAAKHVIAFINRYRLPRRR